MTQDAITRLSPEAELLIRDQVTQCLTRVGSALAAILTAAGISLYYFAESVATTAVNDAFPDLRDQVVDQSVELASLTTDAVSTRKVLDGIGKAVSQAESSVNMVVAEASLLEPKLKNAKAVIDAVEKAGSESTALLQQPEFVKAFSKDIAQAQVPPYTIVMWSRAAPPPPGWALCDGNAGTPNLVDRFIMGASVVDVGKQGGQSAHTHSAMTSKPEGKYYSDNANDRRVAAPDHVHEIRVSESSNVPPYFQLAFIMKLPLDAAGK